MNLRDAAVIALRGLSAHWLRASLSAIGTAVGVASIMLLIAITQAAGAAKAATVAGLSPNIVVVYSAGVSSSGVQVGIGAASKLTSDDVTALSNPGYVPDAVATVPTAGLRTNVSALARIWQTDVLGSTSAFTSVRGYGIAEGRFLTDADVNASAAVVVVGQTVVANLFAGVDPVGQTVQINKHPFNVIGVFNSRGTSGPFNEDDLALLPITSLRSYVLPGGSPPIQQILVQAASAAVAQRVKDEVTNTLLQRHHILDPSAADFQVRTQGDLLGAAERLATVMQWTLGALAVTALLTGAVGIGGLMLTRVGERTHEIRVSRVVGAARSDILAQFVIEGVLLACAAGLAGIALGIAATSLTANIMTDMPAPTVTRTAVAVAVAATLIVGALAGLYPGIRASRLEPTNPVRTFGGT